MQLLFVHGMGRSPLSATPALIRYRSAGITTSTFGYFVSWQDFSSITLRLTAKLTQLATQGEYFVVGHSLGGAILRSAINSLPADTRKPTRLFLLGSPIKASRWAKKLERNIFFKNITGDCGKMLASDTRMLEIPPANVPTTSIVGIKGITGKYSLFGDEQNDSVVSVSETAADWIDETHFVPVIHTFLPSSSIVSKMVLEKISKERARS